MWTGSTIIRKFKKTKRHSSFIDNSWGSDLADMQLISKSNKGTRFLLFVIEIFKNYVQVIKTALQLLMFFKKS